MQNASRIVGRRLLALLNRHGLLLSPEWDPATEIRVGELALGELRTLDLLRETGLRDHEIREAFRVRHLIQGMTSKDAIRLLAEEFSLSEKRVESITSAAKPHQ